jgi:hypothetical protein
VRCENSVWKTPRCTHAATHITSEQRRTPLIIIELRLQNQTRRRRKSSGKEGNLTDIFTTVKKNKKNYLHLCVWRWSGRWIAAIEIVRASGNYPETGIKQMRNQQIYIKHYIVFLILLGLLAEHRAVYCDAVSRI